ncbi:MAG: hypothetical protein V1909_01170 [Candidatus Micrarchaeota archaeon]
MKLTGKFVAGLAGLVIWGAVFLFDVYIKSGGSPIGFTIAFCSAIFALVMGILLLLEKQKTKGLVLSLVSGIIVLLMALLLAGAI